jgi:hypothetical protein
VFGIWASVVGITLRHHEKWADEAQAWLLARDLSLPTLWFKELRYEGSPGLWHSILWVGQHVFHAPYSALGVIGMICAAAGVLVLLRYAPFPRPIRWLLVASYFLVYQYAVIARPYVLIPLLTFVAARLFKDLQHPERITVALVLLANVTAHGALLAGCLGLAYAIEVIKAWPALDDRVRGRFVLAAGAMLLTFFFLFAVLKPPPDVEAFVEVQQTTLLHKVAKGVEGVNGAFFDASRVLTFAWLALVGVWCWSRGKAIVFILPVLVLGMFYGWVDGWAHQQGTIFIAAIGGMWIAWPDEGEKAAFLSRERHAYWAATTALACLLVFQTYTAALVIRNDYLYPYCGAEDAAKYLKAVGADVHPIFGYLYGMVAVEAYFDHNIQANRPTAYFHHGSPFFGLVPDSAEIQEFAPQYIVVACWFDIDRSFKVIDSRMRQEGYSLVHFSDGYLFSKRGWDARQVYFIYRRNGGNSSAFEHPAGGYRDHSGL